MAELLDAMWAVGLVVSTVGRSVDGLVGMLVVELVGELDVKMAAQKAGQLVVCWVVYLVV